MLYQTDRSRLAVPSLFEDGGIRLAIFRDINLEAIFTSQLDVNNTACWKSTAPRLPTGATAQEAVRARGGRSFPAQGLGFVPRKNTFLGREAVTCHRELLQVVTYPKRQAEAGTSTP